MSVQPNFVDLWDFKLKFWWISCSVSLQYQRFTQSACKDLWIGKFISAAKTQVPYLFKGVIYVLIMSHFLESLFVCAVGIITL